VKAAFVLFFFIFSLVSWAEDHEKSNNPRGANFEYEGQIIPEWVNLARKFRKEIPQQGRTGTCASFSSVALVEAACKTVLRKKIDISEAHVITRHVLRKLNEIGIHPSDLGLSDILAVKVEEGNPWAILDSMFNDGLRLEREWDYRKELIPFMKQMRKALGQDFHLRPGSGQELKANLTEEIQKRLLAEVERVEATSMDSDVKECLSKLAPPKKLKHSTPLAAMLLLSQNIPISCVQGKVYEYRTHAFLVMGYRRNQDSPTGFEWLIRDSLRPEEPAKWAQMNETPDELCAQIAYVVPKNKEAKIEALMAMTQEKAEETIRKRKEERESAAAEATQKYFQSFPNGIPSSPAVPQPSSELQPTDPSNAVTTVLGTLPQNTPPFPPPPEPPPLQQPPTASIQLVPFTPPAPPPLNPQ
jgi:hypothetical protein